MKNAMEGLELLIEQTGRVYQWAELWAPRWLSLAVATLFAIVWPIVCAGLVLVFWVLPTFLLLWFVTSTSNHVTTERA